MKRCPSCGETFDDGVKFCDADGAPLVSVSAAAPLDPPRAGGLRTLSVLVVGLTLGLVVGAAAFALYRAAAPEGSSDTAPSAAPGTTAASSAPRPPRVEPEATPTASPTPEATPTPTPLPAQAAPPPKPGTGVETLSDSPATIGGPGGRAPQRVVLHLADGSRVEADDAWRAPEGVWYRRGGIAQLLDSSRVTSVERLAEPTP
jgi:hypothetical protein